MDRALYQRAWPLKGRGMSLLNAYRDALMRLELAAEAMGVAVSDINGARFDQADCDRWEAAANDRIIVLINGGDPLGGPHCIESEPSPRLLAAIRLTTPASRSA